MSICLIEVFTDSFYPLSHRPYFSDTSHFQRNNFKARLKWSKATDQRLNYAQHDALHNAMKVLHLKQGEEKSRFLSVTVEVCRCRVILLFIGGKVMDTFVGTEGGPLRSLLRVQHILITFSENVVHLLLIWSLTFYFPLFPYVFIYLSYIRGVCKQLFPKEKNLKRAQAGLLHWLWAISFLLKK